MTASKDEKTASDARAGKAADFPHPSANSPAVCNESPIDQMNVREYTPKQAFLLAINEAIASVSKVLCEAGVDQETTWRELEAALKEVHGAISEINTACESPAKISPRSAPKYDA